ncbi:MAG: hypothetical protein Gaeavirus3_31, partial [Gaeavirus sp.]
MYLIQNINLIIPNRNTEPFNAPQIWKISDLLIKVPDADIPKYNNGCIIDINDSNRYYFIHKR